MTTYTNELKQKLRDDITFIDSQLDLAREHMAKGDKAEASSLLDGLLDYFDFKKHFPDIFITEDQYMRFQDMYEALRAIDDIIEIDAGDVRTGYRREWRPGYTREEIMRRLRAFLDQIEAWLRLGWFDPDREIAESLRVLKEKIEAFTRYFENNDEFSWAPVHNVLDAKKRFWRALSENLPFAEIYELLMSMDRNLTYLVFRFRLHSDELTLEAVASTIEQIAQYKHSILAIINDTRADDEILRPPPGGEGPPWQPPPGWDDLQPYPPAGYAFFGGSIVPIQASRRTGECVGVDAATAGNSRVTMAGLFGLAVGVIAASILFILFSPNCPV
jgi:tetratricopeptide (TPR) repeat protein